MTGRDGWSEPPRPAPAWRTVLGLRSLGPCRAVDADGQPCLLRAGHRGLHRDAGVRDWLESTTRDALIRTYLGVAGSDRFVAEARLFAEYGFTAIAHEDVRTVTRTGPGVLDIMVLGSLAAVINTTRRRRRLTVCYHRCGADPRDGEHPWPETDPTGDAAPWPVDDGWDAPLDPPG